MVEKPPKSPANPSSLSPWDTGPIGLSLNYLPRDEFESLSTSRSVRVAFACLPPEWLPRFRRLADELEAREDSKVNRARRDALIRAHCSHFLSDLPSRTARAKAIASDFRLAASLASPTTQRLASAKSILSVSEGKPLSWKQIMRVIQ